MRMLLPLLLALAGSAHAATLADCHAIGDASARLVCYDALPLVAAAPAVAPAPAAVAATVAPPSTMFGLSQRVVDAEPKFIESRIEGHFNGWQNGGSIKLANGQVWQVNDEPTWGYNLDNPKVRVTKGMLGSNFLEIEGVNASPRVKRIQ